MSGGLTVTRLASTIFALGAQDELEDLSHDPRYEDSDGCAYVKLVCERCGTPEEQLMSTKWMITWPLGDHKSGVPVMRVLRLFPIMTMGETGAVCATHNLGAMTRRLDVSNPSSGRWVMYDLGPTDWAQRRALEVIARDRWAPYTAGLANSLDWASEVLREAAKNGFLDRKVVDRCIMQARSSKPSSS